MIRTVMSGFPREKPVPTGCSTKRMLERFVQLNSFCVGFACPSDHWNGYTKQTRHEHACDTTRKAKGVRHRSADVPRSPAEGPRGTSTRGRRSSCVACVSSHSTDHLMARGRGVPRSPSRHAVRASRPMRARRARKRTEEWPRTYQKMRSSRLPCGPGGKNQKKS